MRQRVTGLAGAICVTWMVAAGGTLGAQQMQDVQVEATHVAGSVYMLTGRGGNIGASAGPDGVFLVDDQYAPLTEKIQAAVAGIGDGPIRFIINTHWHGDHTGGNENFGEAGAIIVAHENVRQRLNSEQFIEFFHRRSEASPAGALPVITFSDAVTFYWNDDEIFVFHVAPAHTDGDAVIYFRQANVLHGGDVVWNGLFPFIDYSSGGHIGGMVEAVDRILAVVNEETKIIPGHGTLATTAELRAYLDMLATVHERVATLLAEGKTREEIVAANPAAEFDAAWGQEWLSAEEWVGLVYEGMVRR